MAAEEVGSGFIEVNLNIQSGEANRVNAALKSSIKDVTSKVNISINQGDLSRVNNEIKSKIKNTNAAVGVSLDQTSLRTVQAKITDTFRRHTTAAVDISIEQTSLRLAQTRIAELARARRAKISVDVDEGGAEAKLARLSRNRKTEIKADVDKGIFSRIEGMFGMSGGKSGKGFGSAFQNAGESILSTLPGKLESLFTGGGGGGGGAGGVIAAGVLDALYQGLNVGLPAIGAMISGALMAAVGTFGLVAAFMAVKDDPRIKGALQGLQDQFKGIFDQKTKDFIVNQFAPAFNTLSKTLKENAPFIQQIVEAGSKFAGPIADGLKMLADGIIQPLARLMQSQFMKDIMNILAQGIGKIGESVGKIFDKFLKDPKAMEGAKLGLQNLLQIIRWLIDQAGTFLIKMSEMWAALNKKGADGKSTMDKVSDAFTNIGHVLQTIWGIIKPILDAFNKTLGDVFGLIVAIFKGNWSEAGQKAFQIIKDIWNFWLTVMNSWWNAVKGVYGKLAAVVWAALQHLWDVIMDFFKNIGAGLQGWGTNIMNWWNNTLRWLSGLWDWLWAHSIGIVIGFTQQTINMFAGWGQNIMNWWNNTLRWLAGLWDWLWAHSLGAIIGFTQQTVVMITNWGQNIMNWWGNMLHWISAMWDDSWKWVHDTALNWWHNILAFVQGWWTNVKNWFDDSLRWIKDKWNEAWGQIKKFFTDIWDTILNWFHEKWEGLKADFHRDLEWLKAKWNEAWQQIKDFFVGIWNDIKQWITDRWNDIKTVFGDALHWVEDKWNSTWKNVQTFFHNVMQAVHHDVAHAINNIIGVINKGGDVLNSVMGAVGIDFKVGKMDPIEEPPMPPGFAIGGKVVWAADGGPMNGPGTGTSDSMLARVSNGEFVHTAEHYRKHKPLIDAIHQDRLPAMGLQGYAAGGRVKKIWRGANGDNEGLMNEHQNHVHVALQVPVSHDTTANPAIVAALRPSGQPLNPVSGYRASDPETGNKGYHVQGLATDFGGFNQDALATFVGTLPNVLELIHRSASADYGIFSGGGGGGSSMNQWLAKGWEAFLKDDLSVAQAKMTEGMSFTPYDTTNPVGSAVSAIGAAVKAVNATKAAFAPISGDSPKLGTLGAPTGVVAGGYSGQDKPGIKSMNAIIKKKYDAAVAAAAAAAASAGSGALGSLGPDAGNIQQTALATAKGLGANARVILALFEAANVESNWTNSRAHTDHASEGFLQQQVGMGWGTSDQIANIPFATGSFVKRAMAAGGGGSAGSLAQSVQQSGFPGRYDQARGLAISQLAALGYAGPFTGFDNGGWMQPGWNYNGGGQPEMALNEHQGAALEKRIAGDDSSPQMISVSVYLDGEIVDQKIEAAVDSNNAATVNALRRGRRR